MECLQYFRVTQSYNITVLAEKHIGSMVCLEKKNYGPHRFSLHGEAPVTHRLEQK